MSTKKWNILSKVKIQNSKVKSGELLNTLLENRGVKGKKDKEDFLNPNLLKITAQAVGINKLQLQKSIERINKAIKHKEKIIIFGDYDVDGICGSAILWENLNDLGANVLPYIPSRFEEGYGLSIKGIDNVLLQNPDIKLIITVDNGIVANDSVDYANKKNIEVIITDHHVAAKKLPKAYSIVHTTAVCGAGVAYLLSREIKSQKSNLKNKIPDTHLELVCLATIADLVPLTNANRDFVYFGLKALQNTKRPGLLALINNTGIDKKNIGVYEIGHIIAPRLNAMGRLQSAMDSLRLICTTSLKRANDLANLLSTTNLERQEITMDVLVHAKNKAKDKLLNNLIFIADKSYQQGIIGLVAGRLVEEFYLPSIVISKGDKFSKGSVRSIKGFNVIEFLREATDLMVDLGGHPMAAGFTVETKNLEELENRLYKISAKLLNKDILQRSLNIDLELPEEFINLETFNLIQKLSPFGMANPEPLFMTKELRVFDSRVIGKDGKHLKLKFKTLAGGSLDAIAFGMAIENKIKIGDIISAVYTLDINEWNGNKTLQLKIKDLR